MEGIQNRGLLEGAKSEQEEMRFPKPTLRIEDVVTSEDFLRAVDLKTLNEIFDSIVSRSHVSSNGALNSKEEWVGRDKIDIFEEEFTPGGNQPGVYTSAVTSLDGSIRISWGAIEKSSEHKGVQALHMLVHEMTHARSHMSIEEVEVKEGGGGRAIVHQGVGEIHLVAENFHTSPEIVKILGTSLNEAITETIAIEVLAEYMRRTGTASLLEKRSQIDELPSGFSSEYATDRIILNVLIDALAEKVSMDRNVVWHGFVEAYMSGSAGALSILADFSLELEPEIPRKYILTLLSEESIPLTPDMAKGFYEFSSAAVMKTLYALSSEYLTDALKLK